MTLDRPTERQNPVREIGRPAVNPTKKTLKTRTSLAFRIRQSIQGDEVFVEV